MRVTMAEHLKKFGMPNDVGLLEGSLLRYSYRYLAPNF